MALEKLWHRVHTRKLGTGVCEDVPIHMSMRMSMRMSIRMSTHKHHISFGRRFVTARQPMTELVKSKFDRAGT